MNGIGDEGAQTLSEALKNNTSLTSLNLRGEENEMRWKRRNENERNEHE